LIEHLRRLGLKLVLQGLIPMRKKIEESLKNLNSYFTI
jgi:hypothetical protein